MSPSPSSDNSPHKDFAPTFIVGSQRSGTTLLAVLLGRHSALAVTPETHFFRILPRRNPPTAFSHFELLHRFFANKTSANLELNRDQLAARFAQYPPTFASLLRAVLEEFAANHHKPRAGEKTPLHLVNVPQILEWFPSAKIVCILRDGRDVVLSLQRMPWSIEHRLRPLCWHWMQLLHLAEKYQTAYPENFLLIRYEDLLLEPEKILRTVDTFLHLDFEPAQLNPATPTQIVDSAAETWKAAALEKIDPSRIATWKKQASPRQLSIMNSLLGPSLRRHNYPVGRSPFSITNLFAKIFFHSRLFSLWHHLIERNLPSTRQKRHLARTQK